MSIGTQLSRPARSLHQHTVITQINCARAQERKSGLQSCCRSEVGEGRFCPGYPREGRGDKPPGQVWAGGRVQGFLPPVSSLGPTPIQIALGPPVC